MKDATHAARLERVIATLELVSGRLERLTGTLPTSGGTHTLPLSDQSPLSLEEQAKEIADFTKRRYQERKEEYLENPVGD